MAIEILNRGQLPQDVTYRVTCKCCNSLLRFKRSDADLRHDQRDGDFLAIECPVCHLSVYVADVPQTQLKGIGP